MKVLIYVHERTALACGESASGAIDHPVGGELAGELLARGLDELSARWVVGDAAVVNDKTHRLTCACATDASVLDALGSLRHRIEIAQAWAKAVLLTGEVPDQAPHRVVELWQKHPVGLYRHLLGRQVEDAMRAVEGKGYAVFGGGT